MAGSGLAPRVAHALASLPAAQRATSCCSMPGADCPSRRSLPPWGCLRPPCGHGCGAPGAPSAHSCWGPASTSTPLPDVLGKPHVVLKQNPTSREEMNMVDEIELVRQFRSDVPEPSARARAQAWAAVTAVATGERTLAPVVLPRRRRRQSPRRVRQTAALAAAVAAVAAVLIVALSVGSRPSHTPGGFTTPWQPSRPSSRPVSASGAHNSPGALRLVSYIEGPEWKQGSKQVPPGYLDCPAIDACYLLAQTVLTTVGPFPNYYNAVYFSGDGGARWSSLALPAGLELTAPLSCPSALACVGVGDQGNKDELVSTTDGGHRWTVRPSRRSR